ncbi:uncharacterized protein TRIREDRAFT_105206 [Trichoderma reesei QM6a]|uniref:Predicted protein n=2 Tax=Hypocrea jecorina TaxID=51453 RepID=G0RE52_HYPJQ|nr:uncharacterized protein TRIREDRAFT_105206 [Trichoderma reesei QM6a]EGR50766.1 predicted protein [Trichoderma reesei QM6a]ETS05837.1 hypothetical protein M419DRAFT_71285 [Trichoderma reesei RUT C-30]
MNTKSKKKWKRRRILCWFWPWSSDDLGLPTGRWLPAIGVNMAAPGISLDLRTTKSKGILLGMIDDYASSMKLYGRTHTKATTVKD